MDTRSIFIWKKIIPLGVAVWGERVDYIFYVLLAVIVIWFIYRMLPVSGVSQIEAERLKDELKDNNKQFIDVRTTGEYAANHIQGFKSIPLHELKGRTNELSRDQDVYVICQSGMRSMQACRLLKNMGFTKLTNVRGGMNAWH